MTSPSHRHPVAAAALATMLAASSLAFSASAQTPPPAGAQPPRGPGHDPADMQRRVDKRLARLKERLQITPAQEASWSAFTAAVRPDPTAAHGRAGFDRTEFSRLTTPERIDRMRAMRGQRQAQADRRAEATKTFYASLLPDQQKAFDQLPMGPNGRGRMDGSGRHGGDERPSHG